MDEITYGWFYNAWIEDREEQAKFMKNVGCFIGSFYNPAAAKRIQDAEENSNSVSLSDEEFEKSLGALREMMQREDMERKMIDAAGKQGKRGKRRIKIEK